ncbi:MAG: DNA polymerase [Candidatus Micrarchaeia archaeon]
MEKKGSCKQCPLFEKKLVPGYGPLDAKLVIIGECPGETEEVMGKPFVGNSGQLLDKLLEDAGIFRKDCYITNIVACRPTDSSNNNVTPSADIIKYCRERLNEELSKLNPKIVLLLGNVAIKQFLGTSKNVSNSEGIPFRSNGYIVVPTYHPAALLRDPSKIPNVVTTFKRVKEWLEKDPFEWSFEEYQLLYDKKRILEYLNLLCSEDIVACDIETSDITFDSVIFTLAFSTKKYTFGFPIRKPDFSLYWNEKDLNDIVDGLKKFFLSDAKKIFHNAVFDLFYLKKEFGIECKNLYWDTFVFAHLLDENRRTYSLKSLIWKYVGKGGYDYEYESLADEGRPFGLDTNIVLKYNCADAYATYLLYEKMREAAENDPLLVKLHQRLSIPCIYTLVDTRLRGVKIDVDYIKSLSQKFEQDMKDLSQKIYEIAGELFNINSTQALSRILFNKLKLPVLYKTEKGNPSTDVNTLEKLIDLHPIIPLILEYRKRLKLTSTYFENFLSLKDKNDRLHTDYLLTGTTTGRLASRNPNLQNIPRDKEVKDIFVAEKGYFLAELDFKQAELRMLCHYAQDPKMKADFESGFDILKYIASKIYNVPIDQVSDEQRRLTKFVVYGIMYGRGARSIAAEHNMKVEEAERLIASFLGMYENVHRWFYEVIITAKKQGYLRNFFGRVRRFPGINSRDPDIRSREERQALNFLPQSTTSDYTMFKASLLHPILKEYDSYLVLTVHDSLVYEIPLKYAKEVLKIIIDVVSKPIKGMYLSIPFDLSIGFRLGTLTEIKNLDDVDNILGGPNEN